MAKSLKVNFVFNFANTIFGLLFPLITFPYISRVLLADGIGLVQFFQSIINYIALFCALGIPLYAVKEIARVKNNIDKRNQTLVEILILYLSLTFIGYLVAIIVLFSVPEIVQNWEIFLLLSTHLLLVALGAEWFYQGIENFKYISIRSLSIKFMMLIALFVFVHDKGDLWIYALLLVLAEAGNNLFNFIHLRKYLVFSTIDWKSLNIKRHIRPALKMLVLNLIISIYVNLDSVMLGFLVGTTSVGYYTAASRVTRAVCGISSALGGVLLPRLSHCFAEGDYEKFQQISNQTLSFIFYCSMPIAFGLFLTSPQLMIVLCGDKFSPAIVTLQIFSPLVLFLGVSSLLGTRILYAQNKENIVIKSTCIGAGLNFILNMLLIPAYHQNGAAFASTIAEFSVTASMIFFSWNFCAFTKLYKDVLLSIIFSIIMAVGILVVQLFDLPFVYGFILEVLTGIVVYMICLVLTKNPIVLNVKCLVKNRL